MKKVILATAMALTASLTAAPLPIIPKPAKTEVMDGQYTHIKEAAIRFPENLKHEAELLAARIKSSTGVEPKLYDARLRIATPNAIHLGIDGDDSLREAYTLRVEKNGIHITGTDRMGVFYGCQSLLQLIPLEGEPNIPLCKISDQPRFSWRGMHLDVGRHMFEVKDIKKFIDWLAFHKLNTFHWHLTEDQGWRIEIKKYPKLTSVGGYRASTPPYGNRTGSDGKRYGGFYTQEQIKEVVAYAKARHITIVPEIDMPGHMAAAITAYPWLGNDDIPNYKPQVYGLWGVHPYVLAPKEETFKWIDDVLTELCALFPSEYIHIGGDEAPKTQWKKSKFAQSVIKREGLKNEHELQSYFIKRVEKILEKKGRKLIGWDEIREGGLSPNATVMCWMGNGIASAVASAKEGHDVVMAPNSHTYLDHYQRPPKSELAKGKEFEAIGGYLPLSKLYNFEPVPAALDEKTQKHILGVQGQLWTEYMKTWDKVEYMAFPRIAAVAELGWTQHELKDYDGFRTRLDTVIQHYKKAGINHAMPHDPPKRETKDGSKVLTSLGTHDTNYAEFAYDGRLDTFFWSNGAPAKDDHFTVHLKQPTASEKTVTVTTGGTNKLAGDTLTHGILESHDGSGWKTVTSFEKGQATGKLPKGTTRIRLRATKAQEKWLIIREIEVK